VADLRLHFDAEGRRWEGVIGALSDWATLTEVNELLSVARNAEGRAVGFIFNQDDGAADFAASLAEIETVFGSVVRMRASSRPSEDVDEVLTINDTLQSVTLRAETAPEVVPKAELLHSRASDISITDDETNKVITVSLSLPWWARFLRPWIAIRRRGRPEVLALAPLRFRGKRASARMHYGLPGGTSTLVADVVKGVRGRWLGIVASSIITAALFAAALAFTSGDQQGDDGAAAPTTSLAQPSTSTTAQAPETTTSVATTTSIATETTVASIAIATETTQPAPSTTRPPRTTTTSSTLLPPGGVTLTIPSQYITTNDTRADVNVSSTSVRRGQSIDVSVLITGVFINPFTQTATSTAEELSAACRARLGVPTLVPPTPGWSTNVSVSLRGTSVTAGGFTQLVVVGNLARECGNTLTTTAPPTISVVRVTFYREVLLRLSVPATLATGTYELVLDQVDMNPYTKTTPLKITVTD